MKRGRNQRRRQGMNPNRALDSNGPDVRIRGTANQIYDKYQALARDAASSGDRVKAENYLQHAEHYYRLIRAMQPDRPAHELNDDDGDVVSDAQPSARRNGRGGHRQETNGRNDTHEDGSEAGHGEQPRAKAKRPRRDGPADDGDDDNEVQQSSANGSASDARSQGDSDDAGADDAAPAERKPRRKKRVARTAKSAAGDDAKSELKEEASA